MIFLEKDGIRGVICFPSQKNTGTGEQNQHGKFNPRRDLEQLGPETTDYKEALPDTRPSGSKAAAHSQCTHLQIPRAELESLKATTRALRTPAKHPPRGPRLGRGKGAQLDPRSSRFLEDPARDTGKRGDRRPEGDQEETPGIKGPKTHACCHLCLQASSCLSSASCTFIHAAAVFLGPSSPHPSPLHAPHR